MIIGELKSKVDRIWDTMWSGGISNPLSVIEQLPYLLFIKRLDEIQTLKEAKAARTGKPIEDPIFNKKQDQLRCQTSRSPRPTRDPPPSHLPRPLRRPGHQSEGVGDCEVCRTRIESSRKDA